MCTDICTDICIGMCIECIDMCIECIDMCTECIDMCLDVGLDVCKDREELVSDSLLDEACRESRVARRVLVDIQQLI